MGAEDDGLPPVCRLADDFDVGLVSQHVPEALANEVVVVDQDEPRRGGPASTSSTSLSVHPYPSLSYRLLQRPTLAPWQSRRCRRGAGCVPRARRRAFRSALSSP